MTDHRRDELVTVVLSDGSVRDALWLSEETATHRSFVKLKKTGNTCWVPSERVVEWKP